MRALILIGMFMLVACSVEHEATGGTENSVGVEVIVRIEVSFPTCEGIQDERLLVDCVVAASEIIIAIEGIEGLSQDQIDVLDEIGTPVNITGAY